MRACAARRDARTRPIPSRASTSSRFPRRIARAAGRRSTLPLTTRGPSCASSRSAPRENLRAFLARHGEGLVCVVELGVGQRNRAIKAPLMAWAEAAPRASYVAVNREEPVLPSLPPERTVAVRGDIREVLLALAKETA